MLSAQPMRAPVATQPAKLNPIFQATAPKPVITEDLPGYLPTKGELDPTRVLAFKCAVAMLFTRMSVLPELAATITGVNLYLLYLVAPPAIIGCIMTGGFGRAFERKEVVLWSMFYMIMWIDVPFSSWVGLSFNRAFGYLRTDLICLYIVAGLVLGWSDVQKLYRWLAGSGVLVVLMVFRYAKPDNAGRLTLDGGDIVDSTIGNSNDLSGHLMLMMPFIGWYAMEPGRHFMIRYPLLGLIGYGVWCNFLTSSRGALVAMVLVVLFLAMRGSAAHKVGVLVGIPVLAVLLVTVLPKDNLVRLGTLFGGPVVKGTASEEAEESSASRQYLVEQSIKFTLENPMFGVGPGNFSNYEGIMAQAKGEHGNWHETHNTWTQISSECGIFALICFVSAMFMAFAAVGRLYSRAKGAGHEQMMRTCVAYQASMVGYMTCITFLACGYRFTLPVMVGLGTAMNYAGMRYLDFYIPPGATRPVPR